MPALSALLRSPVVPDQHSGGAPAAVSALPPVAVLATHRVGGNLADHRIYAKGRFVVGNMIWKILGTGSAIVAGMVANKVITTLWLKTGRGEEIDPNNPENPIGEAIAFALLAGLATGLARTLATRQAAAFYKKSAGHLPAAMQDLRQELDKVS